MDPWILVIDTSTSFLSVSLGCNGKEIDTYRSLESLNHAKYITTSIISLLEKNNLELSQLNAVAVHCGPGSFTGLRVGSSVAKGLCFGLDIPLISVKGLEAISKTLSEQNPSHSYFTLIDARRNNFYFSYFDTEKKYLHPSSFANEEEIINIKNKISNAIIIKNTNEEDQTYFCSSFLVHDAFEKYYNQIFEDIAAFEPLYLVNNYIKS
jgi:tRNA threonylcarbamoyladenosine biosynthesis protein TsaB